MSAALFKKSTQKKLWSTIRGAFANGAPGWIYDDSDRTKLFQDSAGTSPVTALEQPVGLQLDLSQGLVLGAELVTNGDFATDTAWSKETGWTIGGGTANYSGLLSAATNIYQAGIVTAGTWYKVVVVVTVAPSSTGLYVRLGSATYSPALTVGTNAFYLLAGSTGFAGLQVIGGAVSVTCSVDSISIKKLAGNHRYQPTSANRPTWSARYNLLTKTESFGDAAWSANEINVTPDAIIAPNGTITADLCIPTTANSVHTIGENTGAVLAGVNYTATVNVQKGGYNWVMFQIAFGGINSYQSFNLATGAKGATSGGTATFSIAAAANGFYKITATATTSTTTAGGFAVWVMSSDSSAAYAGDGTSGVYLWGADLRPSDQATGLIPTYQRVNTATDYDANGFPAGLRWNGSNSWMQNASVDFSGTNKVSLVVGVRKQSDSGTQILLEHTASSSTNNGSFCIQAPSSGATFFWRSKGTNPGEVTVSGMTAPITKVLGALGDISAPLATLRVNGVATTDATSEGTGNFSNAAAYFGARAGSSLFFNGLTFSNVCIGIALTPSQIAAFEAWTNARCRAYV